MKISRSGLLTVVSTIVFLAILTVLTYAQALYRPETGTLFDPTLVLIALTPFLFFLIASGQLQQFKGGGFEIILRESISGKNNDLTIEFDTLDKIDKRTLNHLEDLESSELPEALEFIIGKENYYDEGIIRKYLEELGSNPSFSIVVFKSKFGRFHGFTDKGVFERLLNDHGYALVIEIENGEILNRDEVNKISISRRSSNQEALKEMEGESVGKLAVVDSKGRFLGVISQDEIVRKVLSGIR